MSPTEGTTKQHAYRTYLQVQQRLGYKKDPTAWGWKERGNVIYPIHTLEPLIPNELLCKISCRCETGCKKKTCNCRKHGLRCSKICTSCHGESCSNVEETIIEGITDTAINDDEQEEELLERMI